MGITLCEEENHFIANYIAPNRRDRITHELSSEKKRPDCVWRFAHCARDILQTACLQDVLSIHGVLYLNSRKLDDILGKRDVFIIHFDHNWDRKTLAFIDAYKAYVGHGPYIMIDCQKTFAFIETEPLSESHEFLLLCR